MSKELDDMLWKHSPKDENDFSRKEDQVKTQIIQSSISIYKDNIKEDYYEKQS